MSQSSRNIVILVAVALAISGGWYWWAARPEERTSFLSQPGAPADLYSLSGRIVALGDSSFQFRTGIVFLDSQGKGVFEETTKTVRVVPATLISVVGDERPSIDFSELSEDTDVVVYTTEDPSETSEITAQKVEVP